MIIELAGAAFWIGLFAYLIVVHLYPKGKKGEFK